MKSLLYSLMRPAREPSARIPVGVRSAGHYRVAPPFASNIRAKAFIQLFWSHRGTGALVINGVERLLKPRHAALYLPGMTHQWYPVRGPWSFYWLTLDGPLAMPLLMAFGLTADVHAAGPLPSALFRRLFRDLRTPSPLAERRAGALGYHILSLAAGQAPDPGDPLGAQTIDVLHTHWPDPDFNVKRLAALVNVHRSVLSRRFRRLTGAAPAAYLARLRMQHALMLLETTARSVGDIARASGYADPNYFARHVRRVTGMTPRQFREAHGGHARGAPRPR